MKRAVSLFRLGSGLVPALLASMGLALAACGDDDDDSPVNAQGRGGSAGSSGSAGVGGGGTGGVGGGGAGVGGGGAAGAGQGGAPGGQNIVEVASANADFSTLVDLVGSAGLAGALQGAGPFTVFAPNNAAFASLLGVLTDGAACVDFLKSEAGKPILTQILTYHVAPAELNAATIVGRLGQQPSGAFGVDTLLAEGGGKAQIAVTAQAAGGTTTVLLNGGKGAFGSADVIATDVEASNGVIHVVDRVLLSGPLRATLNGLPAGDACRPKTIVDLAAGNAELSTLVDLVTSAGLVGTLQGAGPFTVFAPDNAAFTGFLGQVNDGPACVDFLKSETGKPVLTQILTYHVAPAELNARRVVASSDGIATVLQEGAPAAAAEIAVTISGPTVALNGGGAALGGADVKAADVTAGNGIVHVVNGVLLSGGLAQTLTGLPSDAPCRPAPAAR
jgi:transforming growth factor-beta-induced protein